MKVLVLASVAAMLGAVVMGADSTLEEFDVQKILVDEAKLKAAMACLLDKEPCGEYQPLRGQ